MKVFVTDGNTRAALAITRSLGRAGMEVMVGAERHPCLASASRYCSERIPYPDPKKDYQGFSDAVFQAVKEKKPQVVLPVTDITTFMVAEKKAELEKYCAVPFPEYEPVSRAADKFALMKLAEKLKVPIPRTVYFEFGGSAESAAGQCGFLGYPVVVKPARSRFRTETGWMGSGVRYAGDEKELNAFLTASLQKKELPILLQERIHGKGVGLFACMDGGKVIAAFCHRRLREKPPSGGVSVLRESIPIQDELKDYSERLLKDLGWRGIAMVEFKRDDRTGEFKLMEINGRFWGSLQLAIDAGVDFPSILVQMAVGEPVSPVREYRVGVKTRWLWGDVDVLLALMLKRRRTLNLPPGYPGRLCSLLDFMRFRGKDLHYEVENREDMGPWLYETRSRFRRN